MWLSRSLSNADAIIASIRSKSGKLVRRTIDLDVTSSSIDFTISTSWIQGIVRCGNADFAQLQSCSWLFQLCNSIESRNLPRCNLPQSEISENPSYHCEDKLHQYDSTFHLHFGSVVRRLTCSTVLFSGLFVVPVISGLNSWEDDAKFFQLLKNVEGRPSCAGGRSKTFPEADYILCNSFSSVVDFKFRLFFFNQLRIPLQFLGAG